MDHMQSHMAIMRWEPNPCGGVVMWHSQPTSQIRCTRYGTVLDSGHPYLNASCAELHNERLKQKTPPHPACNMAYVVPQRAPLLALLPLHFPLRLNLSLTQFLHFMSRADIHCFQMHVHGVAGGGRHGTAS